MNNLLDIKTPASGEAGAVRSDYGLENHGLENLGTVYWNLPTPSLYEEIAFRREGRIEEGQLVCMLALGSGLHWGALLLRA